jgi:hypothetical protein
MAESLIFKSWQRSKVFDLVLEKDASGHLKGDMPITIRDVDGQTATDNAPFLLMAATDVAGLKPSAIKHMAPAPFVRDAETTKLVHIDLWDASLPWRYTPQVNAKKLRPWMVLLVGTAKEIQVEGGIANVEKSVLLEHNLELSYLWAHVQHDGTHEIARIVSPRGLIDNPGEPGLFPQHQYVAVLVPAFNDEGEDMWTSSGKTQFGKKGFLPAFHSWTFMTEEAGDFETLAAALKLKLGGNIGKAKLHYRRDVDQDDLHINEALEIRGAITSLQKEPEQEAKIKKVRADLDILNDHLDDTVGLPAYGQPWLENPDAIASGWPEDINDDPRYRGIAGLGLWMGIEAQEALIDAAVKQAGALREAGQRIGNMALGLLASGSLWNRHMPTDKNERLRLLGPMMSRMLATGGGLVMDKVTSHSPLSPSLFSSAAQRILRDRSAQTRHIVGANGSFSRSDAIQAANQLETLPEPSPKGLPHADTVAKKMGLKTIGELLQIDYDVLSKIWQELVDLINSICQSYRRKRAELKENDIPPFRQQNVDALFRKASELLQARLTENRMRCEGREILVSIAQIEPGGITVFLAGVLEEDSKKLTLFDNLWRALCRCMAMRPCEELMQRVDAARPNTVCNEFIDSLPPPPFHDKKPVDLDRLSDLIFDALDPRQPNAPARVRLCSRLKGIDCSRLIRPEFKVGLDFPTWDLLRKYDKEWLLPGVDGLSKDSVVALQTNPAFIDAYMVGINTQFMSEMRWRDLAVDRTSTPLRMFWGQVNYATKKREADIEPLAEWAKTPNDKIGALSHQTIQPDDAGNSTGSRLVIVFRSDLFKRYPSTLVYLVKTPAAAGDLDGLLLQSPVLEDNAADRANKKFFGPVFVGAVTPEIHFFTFDVSPDELQKYWLVLDEPPTELRFRNDQPWNPATHSAAFAKAELDKPTRVAISGAELKLKAINNDNP